MAPLIEALLRLMHPLDAQVFSVISYTLSEEMVYYMEKPGSVLMGMSKSLWKSSGQRVFQESFDPYIVVYDLQERHFHLKNPTEPIGLPRTLSKLLRRTLSSIDLRSSDIYISFQVKQAVFNVFLLMVAHLNCLESQNA